MAKDSVQAWDTNPNLNTDIGGIDIAENCPAAGMNDADRELMAQIATWRDELPYLPINNQTSAYVLAATDCSGVVPITTGGVTVPKNATVPLDVGFATTIINHNGMSSQTITQATDVTLRWGTSTGARTLGARGIATLVKVATDEWYITGTEIS